MISVENIVYVDFQKKEPLGSLDERARYLGENWGILRRNHANQKQAKCQSWACMGDFIMTVNNLIGLELRRRYSTDPEEATAVYEARLERCRQGLSLEDQELANRAAESFLDICDPDHANSQLTELPDNVIRFPRLRIV